MADREAKRGGDGAAGAGAGGGVNVRTPGGVNIQLVNLDKKQPGSAAAAAVPASSAAAAAPRAVVGDEAGGISDETVRRLAAMSLDEIEEARASLAARYKPSALEFLKKRGQRGGATQGAGEEWSAAGTPAGARVNPNRSTATGINATPSSPPMSPTAPKPPTSPGPKSPPPASKRAAAAAAAAAASVAPAAPNTSAALVAAVRYTLEGTPLRAEESSAAAAAAAAVGSAVERDPLRAGHQGAGDQSLGYTMGDTLELARSSVPPQRVAGLTLLARVVGQCRLTLSNPC